MNITFPFPYKFKVIAHRDGVANEGMGRGRHLSIESLNICVL